MCVCVCMYVDLFSVHFVNCGCVCVDFEMSGCVCVDFVMCGCVYVWIL